MSLAIETTTHPDDAVANLAQAIVFVASLGDHDCDVDNCAVKNLREVGIRAEHVMLGEQSAWVNRCVPSNGLFPVVLFEGSAFSAPGSSALRRLRTGGVRLAKTLVGLFRHQAPTWDFSSGFDDFVLRPYVGLELRARIERLTRGDAGEHPGLFTTDRMVVDASRHSVTVDKDEIAVTAKELEILLFLFRHRGALVSRERILRHAWGELPSDNPRMVDIHLSRLRHKLRGALPLRTIRGRGYKLDAK